MEDAEDEDHAIFSDDVVHDPVIAHSDPVERIARALDGLGGLAAGATRLRRVRRESLESLVDPFLEVRGQLLEGPSGAWRKIDVEGDQSRSLSLVDRPCE